MTKNIIKHGMKKLNLNETFGRGNIIKSIENMFLKCIRLGRKKTWIKDHDYIFLVDENKKLHEEIKKLKEGSVERARKAGL